MGILCFLVALLFLMAFPAKAQTNSLQEIPAAGPQQAADRLLKQLLTITPWEDPGVWQQQTKPLRAGVPQPVIPVTNPDAALHSWEALDRHLDQAKPLWMVPIVDATATVVGAFDIEESSPDHWAVVEKQDPVGAPWAGLSMASLKWPTEPGQQALRAGEQPMRIRVPALRSDFYVIPQAHTAGLLALPWSGVRVPLTALQPVSLEMLQRMLGLSSPAGQAGLVERHPLPLWLFPALTGGVGGGCLLWEFYRRRHRSRLVRKREVL